MTPEERRKLIVGVILEDIWASSYGTVEDKTIDEIAAAWEAELEEVRNETRN